MSITLKIEPNEQAIMKKVNSLINNDTKIKTHNLFAKLINPYVPMDEGNLSQNLEITPKYVRYNSVYAHYQYMGIVYAPNYPIMENGVIVGWRSPPGKGTKHPTDRKLGTPGELKDKAGNVIWEFGYNPRHPLATSHWDKVAMQTKKKLLEEGVKNILAQQARDLYG